MVIFNRIQRELTLLNEISKEKISIIQMSSLFTIMHFLADKGESS